MSSVTILIKELSYKGNLAPNTQKQAWRALLLLCHYSIYISEI